MKKFYIIWILISLPILSFTQSPHVFTFEQNNFRWKQNTSSILFFDGVTALAGLEAPINSGNHFIFSHAMWISALDENENHHLSADKFNMFSPPFTTYIPGPLRTDGMPENWNAYIEDFNRFWYVTQQQIDEHNSYFDCLYTPGCNINIEFPSGYEIPEPFLSWPAHGNVELGYSSQLAPFYDRNNNGIYEPNYGDHPKICGDFQVYFISNDLRTVPVEWQDKPLGIEIHASVYGFNTSNPDLDNTLFIKQKIINRSTNNYHDAYIGLWTDFDIGNYTDDYVGTDVQRSMVFAYNGTDYDGFSSSGPGYGYDLAAGGLKILAGPYASANGEDKPNQYPGFETYANQGPGWGDGIPDNERLGLSNSQHHTNDPLPTSDPVHNEAYFHVFRNHWKNGAPITYGGKGYNPNCESCIETKYVFPGMSDPLLAGTNGIDPQYEIAGGWTEQNENNIPSERRILANSGPFELASGQTQTIDYAIIFAQRSQDPNAEDEIEILRNRADAIADKYCTEPEGMAVGISDDEVLQNRPILFPNPTSGKAKVLFANNEPVVEVNVFDISGRKINQYLRRNSNEVEVDLSNNPGVYLVNIQTICGSETFKLVVQ